MKKFYSLLILALFAWSKSGIARTTSCSALFGVQVSNNIAYFASQNSIDSSITHLWYFGDGTSSNIANPVHTFSTCGTYTVYHEVMQHNPNGVLICQDSVFQTVVIVCSTPCNLTASFSAVMVNNQPNVFEFVNASLATPGTAVYCLWNFGDGSNVTTQGLNNQTHTYSTAGLYNVCLIVTNGTTANSCRDTFCLTIQVQAPNPNPCNLQPGFSAQTSPTQPNVYLFSNTSAPATVNMQTTWNFGDSTTGTGTQATHTYTHAGTYNVCMHAVVSNTCSVDTCFTITVTMPSPTPCNVHAGFTTSYTNNQLNVVQCTNTSTAGTSAAVYSIWSFGDGTPSISTSGLSNQTHTYTASGLYTICLKVITAQVSGGVNCADSICHNIQVQVPAPACNLVANFTNAPTSSPYVVSFVNASTGLTAGDSIRWTFGDGTVSYDLNPTHTFANAGTYNVCLRISRYIAGATTPCVSEICHQIIITSGTTCNVHASFTPAISNNQPNTFEFINTSTTGTTSTTGVYSIWSFGDGSPLVNTAGTGNQVHTYAQSGTYTVCLKVIVSNNNGSVCTDSTCNTIQVQLSTPCNLVAGFTSAATAAPNVISFTNTSTGFAAGDSIRWSFGDGTAGYDLNPTHTYTASGTYTVCLRIKKNTAGTAPCVSEICHQVIVTVNNPCNIYANFTAQSLPSQPNVYVFSNTTSATSASMQTVWNFGDSSTATGNQVTHTFSHSGTYMVCMHVVISNTCSADTCIIINVTVPNPTPCNLNPAFTATVSPNDSNLYVFTNTSVTTNAPQVTWSFGDNTTASGNIVTHVFNQPGVYNVCMHVVVSNTCVADTCIAITVNGSVTPPPCQVNASFTWQNTPQTTTNTLNVVYFLNTSTGLAPGDSITWNFGDGTSSNQVNPVHTFTGSGPFNVCLRVVHLSGITGAPPCVSEICRTVILPPTLVTYPNPATNLVNVNVTLNQAGPIYGFIFNSQNVLVGQEIITGVSGNNTITFNTTNLPAGYYTIRLYYDGHFAVARFVKM